MKKCIQCGERIDDNTKFGSCCDAKQPENKPNNEDCYDIAKRLYKQNK